MRNRKPRHERADEWALNSIVAAAASENFNEFKKIRAARKEVDPSHAVTQEYFDLLVTIVKSLQEPRAFHRSDFDIWFKSTCSPHGHKGRKQHVRIPKLDLKGLAIFADVFWMWVCFLRSKYVEVKWR
jgi:hypothetical protein